MPADPVPVELPEDFLNVEDLPAEMEEVLSRMPAPLRERFQGKLRVRGDCWLFGTREWYGQIHAEGRGWYVHRLIWTLMNGPIPPGMEVRHTCDVPPCWRLSHLLLGTHADNMADMRARGRSKGRGQGPAPGTSWRTLHPERVARGENAPQAKLSDATCRRIYRLYQAGGYTQRALADRFSVSQRQIGRIVRGRRAG